MSRETYQAASMCVHEKTSLCLCHDLPLEKESLVLSFSWHVHGVAEPQMCERKSPTTPVV
jgi:hypothetical protein